MKVSGKPVIFTLLAAMAFAAALPAAAQHQTKSEAADLARYQRYTRAPVDSVKYFQINGFQYLARDKLAIWFGMNKMYLLTVQTPCNNLGFANAVGLTSRNQMLHSGFDFVTFDHQRCKVTEIRPVDELKMKQDAAKDKAGPAGAASAASQSSGGV